MWVCGENDRKKLLFTSALFVAVAAPASATVYDINLAGNGVSAPGTITTDGTVGVLGESNVTDWVLHLDDGFDTFTLLGTSNSGLQMSGSNFAATATGLFFDFSPATGYALFQNPSPGSGMNLLCFAAQLCGGSSHQVSVSVTSDHYGGGFAMQGVQQVGSAAAPGVPEPASWALMISGIALVGGVMRRGRTVQVRYAA